MLQLWAVVFLLDGELPHVTPIPPGTTQRALYESRGASEGFGGKSVLWWNLPFRNRMIKNYSKCCLVPPFLLSLTMRYLSPNCGCTYFRIQWLPCSLPPWVLLKGKGGIKILSINNNSYSTVIGWHVPVVGRLLHLPLEYISVFPFRRLA